jgi:RHS repeat-associated protein
MNFRTPIAVALRFGFDQRIVLVNHLAVTIYYEINTTNVCVLIVNYYDHYDFIGKNLTSTMPTVTINQNQEQYAVGSQTGLVAYATNGEALGSIDVYDQKGQVVRSVRKGINGFIEDVSTEYTFTGAIDNTVANVNVGYGSDFIAKTDYTYKYGKKTKMELSLSHGITTLPRETEYLYDAIGRLSSKSRQLTTTAKSDCSYSYDVHGWLTGVNSDGFREYLYYADGLDGGCYNGNISTMKWMASNDGGYRGYNLKYDDSNRLYSAVYGSGDNLSSNKNYFDEHVEYDCNGNITGFQRSGLVDKVHGSFGMVDNLYMTYGGNRLTSVCDNATQLTYEGATDFNGEPKKEYPLTYNDAGSLVSDAGRKIARIDYDCLNHPVRIQFTDGNVTKYIYSATGEKLRVIYQTAVPNISVAIDSTKELAPSEIQCTDYTDYLLGGNLTLKNGHIDKYQFEEGYCQAEKNISDASKDDFTFCYYDQDHLGNIRQVTKADGSQTGNVVQTIAYYPFGMQFCDGTTCYFDQKHKYNGKEFDNMHGLNTYDYGARQYNPVTARWDRMDPLCEKYYNVSPYAYCADNPINNIDPDGKEWGIKTNSNGQQVIYANVELNAGNINNEEIEHYKATINSEFKRMILDVSNGKSIGEINFNVKQAEDQLHLRITWNKAVSSIAGFASFGDVMVNLLSKNGDGKSSEQFAYDNIHELLHTLRMPELTEENLQLPDTKLEHVKGLNYQTLPETSLGIINNVMNYPINYIDGKRYMDQSPLPKQSITSNQLNFIIKEIHLQQNGAGKTFTDSYWNY